MPRYTITKSTYRYQIMKDGEFFASVRADELMKSQNTLAFFRGGYQIALLHLAGEIEVTE